MDRLLKLPADSKFVFTLRLSAVSTLLGWGLMHLFWDVPYRILFWNQSLFEPIITSILGVSWTDYVTDPRTDQTIQVITRGAGVFLVLTSVLALFFKNGRSRLRFTLYLASALLSLIALCLFMDTGLRVGMFIEHASQFLAPILLVLSILETFSKERLVFLIKLSIVGTFLGHGLYAIGYYPMPGSFIDMTINILGVSEPQARLLVTLAGVFDLFVCVGIWVPRLQKPALVYAIVWGLLTTLARPISYLFLDGEASNWSLWIAAALLRFPHFLLPFGLWIYLMEPFRKRI